MTLKLIKPSLRQESFRFRDQSGELVHLETKDPDEALRRATVLRTLEGKANDTRDFGAAVALWLEAMRQTVAHRTWVVYRGRASHWITFWKGSLLQDISLVSCLAFLDRPLWKASTRNQHIGTLKVFWKWAIALGIAHKSPMAQIRQMPAEQKHAECMSYEDARSLLLAAMDRPTPWSFYFFSLCLHSGFRPINTVARLLWSDVDLSGGMWKVSSSRLKMKYPITEKAHPTAIRDLKAWRDACRASGFVARVDSLIFGLSERQVRSEYHAVQKAAFGRIKYPLHSLRVTWYRIARTDQIPFQLAMRMCGHRDEDVARMAYGGYGVDELTVLDNAKGIM